MSKSARFVTVTGPYDRFVSENQFEPSKLACIIIVTRISAGFDALGCNVGPWFSLSDSNQMPNHALQETATTTTSFRMVIFILVTFGFAQALPRHPWLFLSLIRCAAFRFRVFLWSDASPDIYMQMCLAVEFGSYGILQTGHVGIGHHLLVFGRRGTTYSLKATASMPVSDDWLKN